jgi:WD40 repeat protein
VSDDDLSRAERRLIDQARKHQAQPPTSPGKVTVTRVGRFHGAANVNLNWLAMAWSPDGSQLALGGRTSNGRSGVLDVWDGNSGHHETHSMRHLTHGLTGPVIALDWSPDNRHLAAVEQDSSSNARTVHIRSQAEGSRAVAMPPGLPVCQVAWSPDGSTLALSGPDCAQTVLVDAASGAVRRVIDHLSGPVAWDPQGAKIAGHFETSVLLCDPATGGLVGRLAGQEHPPTAMAWARHGKHLAVADGEKIRVWDADDSALRWTVPWTTSEGDRGPDPTITTLQWLDGGRYLLEFRPKGGAWHDELGSTCGTVILWDVHDKCLFVELFSEIENHVRKPIAGLALAPDGRRFAVAFDHIPPVIWKIDGDLPHLEP